MDRATGLVPMGPMGLGPMGREKSNEPHLAQKMARLVGRSARPEVSYLSLYSERVKFSNPGRMQARGANTIVDFNIEALQDFVSERERLSHVPRLVISSEHDHIAGEVLLDREEKYAYLNAKNTAIDIVTEEQVIQ